MTPEEAREEQRSEIKREEFGALEVRKQVELSVVAAAEHSKALIQAKFIVAIKQRRNIDDVRCRILEACRRPRFAEKVRYAKPIGGGKIQGPSIKFADEAARIMGNLDISKTTIYEDEMIRKISVTALDLETNVSKSEEVIIKRTVERKHPGKGRPVLEWRMNTRGERVAIVIATDDELLVKEQALCAKARRNLELQLIPQDIIEEGIDESIKVLQNRDAKDPDAAKKRVVDAFFTNFGVRPSDLEDYLRHPIDKITPAEIASLREVYESMIQGEATWTDFVSVSREEGASDKAEESPAAKNVREKLAKKKSPIDPPSAVYGEPTKHEASAPAEPPSPIDPKDKQENGGEVKKPSDPLDARFERARDIAMMLGPFVDPDSMPGTYRMMVFGRAMDQVQTSLVNVGFVMGIKRGFGPKMVKEKMSAGDISQWLAYLFDFRDVDKGNLAYEADLLKIAVIDEATGEYLIGS